MKFLEISLIGFVLFFSFIINFYYGHQGLMPLDDLQNFNSGYRILTGDFPFRDYYSITGPFLDKCFINLGGCCKSPSITNIFS